MIVGKMTQRIRDVLLDVRDAWSEWLDAPTTRRAMIPAYLVVIVAVSLGVWRLDSVSQQRAEDAQHFAAQLAATQCFTRADGVDDLRSILLSIIATLPSNESTVAITDLINTDYPAVDRQTCINLLNGQAPLVDIDG